MTRWLKDHKEAILATVVAMKVVPGIPSWISDLASSVATLALGT